MKQRFFGNIRPAALIMLLLSLPLCKSCKEEKIQTPEPDQGCGFGEGEYEFHLVNSVPDSFDCNASGRFVITIRPDSINPSYGGIDVFNRLYFILDNGSDIYHSNYVEFLSDSPADQELEWGGSLPTGDYVVRGRMRNIQLNSTCEDSVYKAADKNLGWVHITEFGYPAKTMEIEYFCQDSDIGTIERYDVFLSPNTAEYCSVAFSIANTRYNVATYLTDLTPELIRDTLTAVRDYIRSLKDWPDDMFLCGIKGFMDANGNLVEYLLGLTPEAVPYNSTPNCSTGSLVAVKACINVVADRYKIDYNDFVTATTIHELGWQRAISSFDPHDSEFCIMNVGLVVVGERNRYSNPHFCDRCITKIKNVSW
jgi:hypothetical protein